jgi:hypothetical protein
VRRLAAVAAAALAVAAGFAVPRASPAPGMLVGLYDEGRALYGDPAVTFPILQQLRVQVLRVNLYWGGPRGVATGRPSDPANPADPAYDWAIYDRTVRAASSAGIRLLFSIYGTPGWENGSAGLNRAPVDPADLQSFAQAAATRYSGLFVTGAGLRLPAVTLWLAWNEPNNPLFLSPQYARIGGRWTIRSAADYAKICAAVYAGVHAVPAAGELVGCGVTGPRGNNNPLSTRPSVSPVAFLRALKSAGLRQFDAYADHPYYGAPSETPATKPHGGSAITLGNIGVLIGEVQRLYGRKPIWITEYGYQTNPPDRIFGVSWAKQAAYLTQAYAIARRNPSIQMMLWFLLQDEPALGGWQSGLLTTAGTKKPAFAAYAALPH